MQDVSFVEVKVDRTSLVGLDFIVFLSRGGDERMLPIVIGALEAQSIAACYRRKKPSRPLSHDLFTVILKNLKSKVEKVFIRDLKENTFYARVFVRVGRQELDFDARPSDAIALALRFSAPIYADRKIFEKCSINLNDTKKEIVKQKHPIQKLKAALDKAIADERYEVAAKLRDKIQQIESKNELNSFGKGGSI